MAVGNGKYAYFELAATQALFCCVRLDTLFHALRTGKFKQERATDNRNTVDLRPIGAARLKLYPLLP
jgi:hypothetical protein